MECVACGRERIADEPGWVIIVSPPNEPRILYCPECLEKMVRVFGAGEQDD